MGEGRRDRSSGRHRANLGCIEKSSSDTEIARPDAKNREKRRKKKGEKCWPPFLESLTVDELGRYRRRRVENYPKDTLVVGGAGAPRRRRRCCRCCRCCRSCDGKHEAPPLTEYRRAFRAISEDSIVNIVEKPSEIPDGTTGESIVEPLLATAETPSVARQTSPTTTTTTTTTTTKEQNCIMKIALEKSQRHDRGSRGEGDKRFYGNTEYSRYVSHEGNHRAKLARRPTSLKIEGETSSTRSEQCDNFVEWPNVARPKLARVPTNLKLEGDIETITENHDKYVPFVGARRPELLRQMARLKLEGESTFLPEYTDVFREHDVREKRKALYPENHLKTGENFYEKMEIDNERKGEKEERERDESAKERDEIMERDTSILLSKLEESKRASLPIPEYKDAYKVFPRERAKLFEPESEIGRTNVSKIRRSRGDAKFPRKIPSRDLEYGSKFLDGDEKIYGEPSPFSSPRRASAVESRTSRESRKHGEATSEARSRYLPHARIPRVETLEMPGNLRLEGSVDPRPEYREACSAKRDGAATRILINEPRVPHRNRGDRGPGASKKSYRMNEDNGEEFGEMNAADDREAFQLLGTKIREESVVGKPPVGSGRVTHRSPSPSYRLRVCNAADENPRGFARRTRRSASSFRLDERRAPSPASPTLPDRLDRDASRGSYSPSFGGRDDERSFLVLDDDIGDRRLIGDRSKKLIDRNLNGKGPRGRPRTPTNWMPPWYDNNTNTV